MDWRDTLSWLGGVVVFTALVWVAARYAGDFSKPVTLIEELCVTDVNLCVPDKNAHPIPVNLDRGLLVVVWGVPWFLLATISAHTVYLLLRSNAGTGDVEREWLGRASGWHFIVGLGWMLLSILVLFGPHLYYSRHILGQNAGTWLTAITTASGAVTAFLGKSGLTPAKGGASGVAGISSNIALAIAGPLFAALLLILISLLVDWPIAGHDDACFAKEGGVVCGAGAWVIWAVAIVIFLTLIDGLANVNRFSIHALYRNRLVRAYLGGARAPNRAPDGFTDFDWDDNVRMASLWNDRRTAGRDENWKKKHWRPFHVINMTLNIAATKNFAWQQRKARSFTVTPHSCGNADLGYRATHMYGGPVVA